jgi:hypothetical protein
MSPILYHFVLAVWRAKKGSDVLLRGDYFSMLIAQDWYGPPSVVTPISRVWKNNKRHAWWR